MRATYVERFAEVITVAGSGGAVDLWVVRATVGNSSVPTLTSVPISPSQGSLGGDIVSGPVPTLYARISGARDLEKT